MVDISSSRPKFGQQVFKMLAGCFGRCTGSTASKADQLLPEKGIALSSFFRLARSMRDRKIKRNRPEYDMRPSQALTANRSAIRKVTLAHRTVNARVFGSVVHRTDTEESDLDILVDPTPDTTLFDIAAIRFKLRNLLGVQVDVLTPNALPERIRQKVLSEAEPV